MLLILLICIACKKSYAVVVYDNLPEGTQYRQYVIISYRSGIFLIIWQWIQYIFPIYLTLHLIIVNRKEINYKKIIIFIIVGIIAFGACYFVGEFVLENDKYYFYSGDRIDMDNIKYNGKDVYLQH